MGGVVGRWSWGHVRQQRKGSDEEWVGVWTRQTGKKGGSEKRDKE